MPTKTYKVSNITCQNCANTIERELKMLRGVDDVRADAEAKTVTVKVKKPGRGKDAKLLKKNKEAVFAVKPEGSVLTRTTVAINGVKGEIADIPAGKTVNVYWRPDENDPSILRARKIDVIMSDAELDAKYGTE